jgi:hypothetical protein
MEAGQDASQRLRPATEDELAAATAQPATQARTPGMTMERSTRRTCRGRARPHARACRSNPRNLRVEATGRLQIGEPRTPDPFRRQKSTKPGQGSTSRERQGYSLT